jgi:hypothetical protein
VAKSSAAVDGEAVVVPAQQNGRRPGRRAPAEETAVDGGRRVLTDEPELSNLPGNPPTKVRKITLADGTVEFGCAACSFVESTRDRVRKHHRQTHGAPTPEPTRAAPIRRLSIDAADASITLAELMQLATSSSQWATLVEQLTAQRDQFKERALSAESKLRRLTTAMERLGFVAKPDDGNA